MKKCLKNWKCNKRRKSYFHQRPGLIPCWIHKPRKKPTRRSRHLRKPCWPGEIIVKRHLSIFKESLSREKEVLNWATICALETASTLWREASFLVFMEGTQGTAPFTWSEIIGNLIGNWMIRTSKSKPGIKQCFLMCSLYWNFNLTMSSNLDF